MKRVGRRIRIRHASVSRHPPGPIDERDCSEIDGFPLRAASVRPEAHQRRRLQRWFSTFTERKPDGAHRPCEVPDDADIAIDTTSVSAEAVAGPFISR